MRRLWARQWLRFATGLLLVLCLGLLLACWRFRIWSRRDYIAYQEVRQYSIGEDLWFGRIQAGLGLESFTAEHPPHETRRVGPFVSMNYYAKWPMAPDEWPMESISVIARDGRLVYAAAGGCTWDRVFFEMNAEDDAEWA